MRELPWEREQRILDVREKIWAHISPTATPSTPNLLVAAQLLGWHEDDAYALARVQLMLSPEVDAFVDALAQLVRRLSTDTTRELDWNRERLLGPVVWGQTLTLRATSGQTGIYVTAPARRVYQTPENELLVHVLDGIISVGRDIAWPPGKNRLLGNRIYQLTEEAARWQPSRMLHDIRRMPPTPRSLMRIATGRSAARYETVLAAYDRYHALIEEVDRDAIRQAVEQAGLVTADEATLFELLSVFAILDALNAAGWRTFPLRLLTGRLYVRARHSDGRRLDVFYQAAPDGFSQGSRYLDVLAKHKFDRQPDLRPDLVLGWEDPKGQPRRLLVECKLSQTGGVRTAARRAAKDLLMYRRSFGSRNPAGEPYGLGIAWGAGLEPTLNPEILLCTPDTIAQAISMVVR